MKTPAGMKREEAGQYRFVEAEGEGPEWARVAVRDERGVCFVDARLAGAGDLNPVLVYLYALAADRNRGHRIVMVDGSAFLSVEWLRENLGVFGCDARVAENLLSNIEAGVTICLAKGDKAQEGGE